MRFSSTTPSASRDKPPSPTSRSPSTSPPASRTSSRPTQPSSTKPPPPWTEPDSSCQPTSPAPDASPHSGGQNALFSQLVGRGVPIPPVTRKYQVKGLIAGNGRRAFHHPVPAHTPGSCTTGVRHERRARLEREDH